MNQRIEKVAREIEKSRARIAEEQARLKELERQKTDLENTEIIALFRSVDVAPGELAAFIRAYKQNGGAPSQAAPALEYPRSGNYGNPAPEEQEDDTDE